MTRALRQGGPDPGWRPGWRTAGLISAGVVALLGLTFGLPLTRPVPPVAVPLVAAPGAALPVTETPAAKPEKVPPPLPDGMLDKFKAFVPALWPDAEKKGVSRALFERAFAGLEPDAEIFELMANQPEHVATPWDYLNRLASEKRIETGRQKLAEHGDLLAAIEARYGVDRRIVVAVWGIESSFGVAPGSRSVIRSLATLAAGDPARPAFWRGELLTALGILERGDIALDKMTGSWAGAMGHTQFMPSSYLANAVDFDGDGRRDIWGSVADALASTANYLKVAGWKSGEPWGFEAVLPAGFDHALAAPGQTKPLVDWLVFGVSAPPGQLIPPTALPLALVLPAGARGPAFLVSPNFRAILRYNNAVPYALAVGHLADRIAGGAPVAGLWPTDDPPLNRPGREELQRRLQVLGHEVGMIDGIIGAGTRAAVRAYQQKAGLAEDGYAGVKLLERLRQDEAK